MSDTVSSLLSVARDLSDHESIRLLLAAAGRDRSWLLGDPTVPPEIAKRFHEYLVRRRRGEPVQYIEGSTQFGPITLRIDERALIPRPETERLWELCLPLVAGLGEPTIVDLCTGSGNLALALKHAIPHARVFATDLSSDALALATENSTDLGLEVSFVPSDLFGELSTDLCHRIDLIVSNPPYVSDEEYRTLPTEVAGYEPISALVAGGDGLDVLRRIATAAVDWLRPGGFVICEIGETQGGECLELFSIYEPEIIKDLTGRDRFVLGCAPMMRDVH